MSTWRGVEPPELEPMGPAQMMRAVFRAILVVGVVLGALGVIVPARALSRALGPRGGCALKASQHAVSFASRNVFRIIGMGYSVTGKAMEGRGAVVANHSSWLDIFALNACQHAVFVSKDDVARWPLIGLVARAVGTLFIKRDPKEARIQQTMLEARIRAGEHLVFFPEGTSSDGLRVLPFKSTLFAAFFTPDLRELMLIQPVSVVYHAPENARPSFYGFWGHTSFAPHFLRVLGARRQGAVEITFHAPVKVADFASRKDLCAYSETQIRSGFEAAAR